MRIPIWPGVRLSVWERQDPEAVSVRLAAYYKPPAVRRVASKRGWMLLLVRYDWRDPGHPGRAGIAKTDAPVILDPELDALRRRAHP